MREPGVTWAVKGLAELAFAQSTVAGEWIRRIILILDEEQGVAVCLGLRTDAQTSQILPSLSTRHVKI